MFMKNIGFSLNMIYLIILKMSIRKNKKGDESMERGDFKKITRENLKTCREIVLSKGDCIGIECETCLFSSENTKLNCGGSSKETLALCKEALEKFGEKRKTKIKHHHITRNEMKKFYTYLKQKYGVAGEKTNELNSYENLERGIEKVVDEVVTLALIEQKKEILAKIDEF